MNRTHPCIGVCSTTVGDRQCRGCKRTVREIREWNAYPADKRKRMMIELKERV